MFSLYYTYLSFFNFPQIVYFIYEKSKKELERYFFRLFKFDSSIFFSQMIGDKYFNETTTYHCRVVVIGDASVGKTSILNQLIDNNFHEHEQSTVGANYQLYVEEIDGIKIEIQIWDTAGQEKFRSLGPIYYRNSNGAIIMFDMTSRKTFEDLDEWIQSLTNVTGNGTVIFIVGNKADLTENFQVSMNEVNEWAKQMDYKVMFTSAKTGKNVTQLFHNLSVELLKSRTHNYQKSKNDSLQVKDENNKEMCKC